MEHLEMSVSKQQASATRKLYSSPVVLVLEIEDTEVSNVTNFDGDTNAS